MIAPLLGLAVTTLVIAGGSGRPRRSVGAPSPGPGTSLRSKALAAIDRVLPGRRDRQRDLQLTDALDRLAAALRAGDAIGPALVTVAVDVSDPLGVELRRVARSIAHGVSVAESLATWAGSARSSRDVRLVAAALSVGAGSGGEVARSVDGVAATLRERHEVAAEARALATQARASATLLVAAPLAFTALVSMVEPGAIAFLFTTPVGLGCLVLGFALDVGGGFWMARITRSAA